MKTAVIVNDTNMSDLNYHVMTELNNMVSYEDVFLLTNNVSSKVIEPLCAIMNTSKIAHIYDGLVISTSVDTTMLLQKAAISSRKVWYIYDLEWLASAYDFNMLFDIFSDKNLLLIARSELVAGIIESNFNRKIDHIVPEFRLDEIWNLLENTKKS